MWFRASLMLTLVLACVYFRPLAPRSAAGVVCYCAVRGRPPYRGAHALGSRETMYAIVKTGGKQYRVAKDDVIRVERLPGEAGETITLGEVLMVGGDEPKVGAPL